MRSLVTDPLSWWPLGFAVGGLIGAALKRVERVRAARRAGESPLPGDHVDPVRAGGRRPAAAPIRAARRAG